MAQLISPSSGGSDGPAMLERSESKIQRIDFNQVILTNAKNVYRNHTYRNSGNFCGIQSFQVTYLSNKILGRMLVFCDYSQISGDYYALLKILFSKNAKIMRGQEKK